MGEKDIRQRVIDTIRVLSAEAIQKANSGHPGMPLGFAPAGFILFDRFMRYNPKNPGWAGRDRFILSAGHASMLLYSLLHLYHFPLPLDEIKRFRQLGSRTPGHPEYDPEIGVEATTGTLGQGFGMGVGMALALEYLSALFDTEDITLFGDSRVFVIASDGDLMEGISYEAGSFAGHQKLDNLLVLWDDNRITIEGRTSLAWSEDVLKRFESFGWYVDCVGDVNDIEALSEAIEKALSAKGKPRFIAVRSVIGYGTGLANNPKVHGSPIGEEELRKLKEKLGFPVDREFYIPGEVMEYTRRKVEEGQKLEEEWNSKLEEYSKKYPEKYALLQKVLSGKVDESVWEKLPRFTPEKPIATRSAIGKVLEAVWEDIPFLIGGSADLGPSNKTYVAKLGDFSPENRSGRNIHYGVREHAMAAISNGMALTHLRPFAATFLVFSDYMRPALRLSALMKQPVIYIFTHDSIGLGEDGPTHQPIEHLPSLRAMPHLVVIRPADANETARAFRFALEYRDGPVALILTRQNIPVIEGLPVENLPKGAYVVKEAPDEKFVLYASGSELHIALETARLLEERGYPSSVINVPSWELFDRQTEDYRRSILNRKGRKVYIEASMPMGWEKFVGEDGIKIGVEDFGLSAPYKDLYEYFGLTPQKIVEKLLEG